MPVAHQANSFSAEVMTAIAVSELIFKTLRSDFEALNIVSQSVIMIVPSMNPDGQIYLLNQYKGDALVEDIEKYTKNRVIGSA